MMSAQDELIQMLLRKELRYLIRDLRIVQIGHQEVRIAPNADLRQMHELRVATT